MPDPKLVFVEPGDFGINRVGQRVRCVMPVHYVTDSGKVSWPGVDVGTEYTVGGFLECQMTEPHSPGIELKEVQTPTCACCGKVLSFPIFAFRPIISPNTEARLEELKAVAARQTAAPDVKVPLEVVDRFAEKVGRAIASFSIATFIVERLGFALKGKPKLRLPDAGEFVRELMDDAPLLPKAEPTLLDELKRAGVKVAEDGRIISGHHRVAVILRMRAQRGLL